MRTSTNNLGMLHKITHVNIFDVITKIDFNELFCVFSNYCSMMPTDTLL